MNFSKAALLRLLKEDSGQDLVEYALVLGVITLGSISAINGLVAAIETAFTTIDGLLTRSV